MILVGHTLLVEAKSGKKRRQSHLTGNRKEKARPLNRTLGGDLLVVAVTENQGLPHGMILGLRNLSPGVEIETILGMERGVHLLQGILIRLSKGCLRRKNGCRKVDW
jgi:hypothetical protein